MSSGPPTESPFELLAPDVHVWAVHFEGCDELVERCLSTLSVDEKVRAGRFRFKWLQRSHVLSQGVLRALLARYTLISPADVRFSYGSKGKPSLGGAARGIRFNASHSGATMLYAITLDCELGVDLEEIRPLSNTEGIAERFLCPEEAAELLSLPAAQRQRAFINCWTRKEAYVKAVGDGLSVPLDSFRVTLMPGDAARVVHLAHNYEAAREWTLQDLAPALANRDTSACLAPQTLTTAEIRDSSLQEFAAALAYRDAPRPIRSRSLKSPAEILALLDVSVP